MSTVEAVMSIPVSLFDPESEVFIVERNLPHWTQPGE